MKNNLFFIVLLFLEGIEKQDLYVVGIGVFVGGLEVIEQFFVNMFLLNGMVFIIVQYFFFKYKSFMSEFLVKKIGMNIKLI